MIASSGSRGTESQSDDLNKTYQIINSNISMEKEKHKISSEILKQKVVYQQHAVDQQALLLLAWLCRQTYPVFIVLRSVLREPVEQMDDFTHQILLQNLLIFFLLLEPLFVWWVDLYDFVLDSVETAQREDDKMPSLRV